MRDEKPVFVEQYGKIINSVEYYKPMHLKEDLPRGKEALDLIYSYLNLPDNIKKMDIEIYKLLSIQFDNSEILPEPYYPEWPKILQFAPLRYAFKNGDVLFASNIYDKNKNNVLYSYDLKQFNNDPKIVEYLDDEYSKIKINEKWYQLKIDYTNGQYFYILDNSKNYFKNDKLPAIFREKRIGGPVFGEFIFALTTAGVYYNYGKKGRDQFVCYYNYKTSEIRNSICFPAFYAYHNLNIGIDNAANVDSNNRIYFAFNEPMYNEECKSIINDKKITSGHIMIYDPEKDTLFNVRHPFWDEENKDEKMLAYQYVLGEDENIYYQLVTDRAYYIYKIKLLWDQPMENDEYKPYFIEIYTELKEAFDAVEIKAKTTE